MDDEAARAREAGSAHGQEREEGAPGDAAAEVVRTTQSPTKAGDWDLVLASAGIPRRLVQRDGAFVLLVPGRDAPAAREALAAFDAESVPVAEPPAPDLGPSALGIAFGAILLAFFVVAGGWSEEGGGASRWVRAGSASAELILHGQWWRVVTALTLHGDVLHLAGNVLASLLFVSAVGRWLGPGLGGVLILLSAAGANLLVAAYHRTAFVSIGASTATFAALGILVGLQLVRRWRHGVRRRYAWLPLGAGLGLYAMLGTSAHADFLAHLFGLGLGVAGGAAVAAAGVRAPGRLAQAALAVVLLAVVAGCWYLALRGA
jgi:membrane associated rhomboid family serine protease